MYNKSLNYCSYSPDKLFGVNFNYACYLHDRQYRNEVKIRKTRKQSDQDLKNMIYKKFVFTRFKKIGWLISRTYYLFVRLFGKLSWDK